MVLYAFCRKESFTVYKKKKKCCTKRFLFIFFFRLQTITKTGSSRENLRFPAKIKKRSEFPLTKKLPVLPQRKLFFLLSKFIYINPFIVLFFAFRNTRNEPHKEKPVFNILINVGVGETIYIYQYYSAGFFLKKNIYHTITL